jgi:hypothetical protein
LFNVRARNDGNVVPPGILIIYKRAVGDISAVVARAIPIAVVVAAKKILRRYEHPPIVGASIFACSSGKLVARA